MDCTNRSPGPSRTSSRAPARPQSGRQSEPGRPVSRPKSASQRRSPLGFPSVSIMILQGAAFCLVEPNKYRASAPATTVRHIAFPVFRAFRRRGLEPRNARTTRNAGCAIAYRPPPRWSPMPACARSAVSATPPTMPAGHRYLGVAAHRLSTAAPGFVDAVRVLRGRRVECGPPGVIPTRGVAHFGRRRRETR